MAHYGRPQYWDERYQKDPDPFDWYQRYSGFSDKLLTLLSKEDRVLNLGCGNSRITEEMYEDGFKNVVNIDISNVVIKLMSEKHKDKTELDWKVMNATHLDFEDNSFDLVFDKGTLDSLLCGENSTSTAHKSLKESFRVLKPGGVFFCVSYGRPENRLSYLENVDMPWQVEVETVPKPSAMGEATSLEAASSSKDSSQVHFIYICKKPLEVKREEKQEEETE